MALLMLAASAQQPYPFQFDVPYACPDGSTYVMQKCVTGAKGEFCSFLRDNNPQYSTRADMTTRMSRCTIKGGGSPTTPPPASAAAGLQENTPYQCAGALTVTAFECQRQAGQEYCFVKLQQNGKFLAQLAKPRDEIAAKVKSCQAGAPFNPPYLSEFPSPDRVVAAMRAGGARDNVLRAIGAFYQLDEIINALAGDRASGSYLPDERKFLDQYRAAITEMQKAAEKAFPAERFDVTSNPYHFSRSDPKFGFEGIPVWVTLLSPTVQARFAQTVGASDARYLAAVEQEKRAAIQRANADLQAAQAQARMPRDQGSVAARKCIESGRSEMECLGEGLKIGSMN
jgi:hypothetical protein